MEVACKQRRTCKSQSGDIEPLEDLWHHRGFRDCIDPARLPASCPVSPLNKRTHLLLLQTLAAIIEQSKHHTLCFKMWPQYAACFTLPQAAT